MDQEDDVWAAIERVLAGDATTADELLVSRWTREDPANEAELRRLEAAWQIASSAGRGYDSRAAWSRVRSQIDANAASPPDLAPRAAGGREAGRAGDAEASRDAVRLPAVRGRRRGLRGTALAWAAVAVLVLGAGAIVARVLPTLSDSTSLMAQQVTTGVGQRATVRLGDGSVVVLGPRSTLADVQNDEGERRIALTGSAHFEVTHDPQHPFVVMVGTAEARVLGTSFTVRGYDDGTPIETVVESGRVSMRAHGTGDAVVLTAGEMGRVDADGNVSVRRNVDVAAHLGWRDGTIRFDGSTLAEVAATLERWYSIDVVIADSAIAAYPLTATFTDAAVDDVLSVVSRTLGVRHSFDGSTAEFRP